MLPTVAHRPHFQPHHHLDHQMTLDTLNYPYDLNDPAFQNLHLDDCSKNNFYQSIPRTRLQFPHPVQQSNPGDVARSAISRSANTAEHTLRRKTPNGTLAAGYDGTPGDRAIQPPATKHILVSSLEGGHAVSSQPTIPLDSWRQKSFDQTPSSQYQNFPPSFKPDMNRGNTMTGGFASGPNGTSWIRSLNYNPGVDSVLNQTLPMQPQQRYYLQNGSFVPTVLPATLQSGFGPTASAGVGPYGPYWPDGAYIPYRPAALRDARFSGVPPYCSVPGPDGVRLFDDLQSPFGRVSIHASTMPTPGFSWNPVQSQTTHTPQLYNNAEPLLRSNFPRRHSQHNNFNSFQDQTKLPFRVHDSGHVGLNKPAQQHDVNNMAWHPLVGSNTPLPMNMNNRPGNVEFKEKILSWAHGVYVDLLASLHESRRKSMSKGQHDGQARRLSRPNIYPKPPRQPGLDFSLQNSLGTKRHDGQTGVNPDEKLQFGQLHHRSSSMQGIDAFRTIRRTSGTGVSRMISPQSESSVMLDAMSALEMLSSLCLESGWEWIDGMLLGGCLAYGLGDYHKAMRWYSRIIARDSSHVEAISNLAATLLALDRREEAAQHWLRAVKLRPSYFEAVEHLIGLLCSNHRGKEAVNIIEFVENSLRVSQKGDCFKGDEFASETESDTESRSSCTSSYDKAAFDYDADFESSPVFHSRTVEASPGFASSGYAIPGSENGRMLALVHAKGNMLYALGDNAGAAAAFEDAILIGGGRRRHGIHSLIKLVLAVFLHETRHGIPASPSQQNSNEAVLLFPDKALQTSRLVFPPHGELPGFKYVPEGLAKRAVVSTVSNSLLSLAKIYQDGMASPSSPGNLKATTGVREILALYYLSLSLQPSPSTANNVGILLASIQQNGPAKGTRPAGHSNLPEIPGVIVGSGVSLALAYYNYGLSLDARHAHLYTNLGSLLKDIGQLPAAVRMYEQAVQCDGNFDIALANLANAVKDSGKINDAIGYYRRAVSANPDFAEAVCGLANALNSVCNWGGRGGIATGHGFRDRWHVDEKGMIRDVGEMGVDSGWIKRIVDIVKKQLNDGETWGCGIIMAMPLEQLCSRLIATDASGRYPASRKEKLGALLQGWAGQKWEGSRMVRLVERAIRWIGWQWYQDRYVHGKDYPLTKYSRPQLPPGLSPPSAPTVLPFHTFTCPLSAKQIRHISQRNGLRISCSTLRSPWLPVTVYRPPSPPKPHLNVGYVSSDFNNHPLAHLMQSVFGLHNPSKVKAFCYATTASDNSVHRQQIEREASVFYDASTWPVDRLVEQIVKDGIHILVNLNGYTRGARNEVFAARPAPIHMSFMGFAGTLGAEWCDYILADEISIPPETLNPLRRKARMEDRLLDVENAEELEDWVYDEKIVYTRDTFFCCDHRQSAPDASEPRLGWDAEQERRWKMRKEMFPTLSDDAIIFGNFNQLYKIEPTTFRTWLRILSRVPRAILWLLRFPDVGEQNLKQTAIAWAGESVASRIIFTDVAPKHQHISRAKICDLFLDTPECNAHTTAADVLWSGTPLLTYPRYKYKMCSRMASSILTSALPSDEAGRKAASELIVSSDEEYESRAIQLGLNLAYVRGGRGKMTGRLADLRRMLFMNRWESKLFDTKRWVRDLEEAYELVWKQWLHGEEGDIWL